MLAIHHTTTTVPIPRILYRDDLEVLPRLMAASIGKKWKDWKYETKKQAYYPYRTDVERLARKPDRVEESHWREKSERDKLIQSKKNFITPLAEQALHVLWKGQTMMNLCHKCQSSMQSSSAVDEVFTQVMGLERPGRVRTYGFGSSPRDVFGHKKLEKMQAMFAQLDEQLSRHKAAGTNGEANESDGS
ncbi:unnamed protein product [Ilex paraguariensis]|uniref:Uncharacterized protein n=1 Tax=Ilex paraguariensis TaxID=185542 RepID=A0ABC8R1R0_9AQUA